jgi:hypothetical protein
MEKALWSVKSEEKYRFDSEWAFQMGWTAQRNRKMSGFPHVHPIITEKRFAKKGVNKTHPQNKKRRKCDQWQLLLFEIATALFSLIIPEFVKKQYVFHFGKMSSGKHQVPPHTDKQDIAAQYAIHFGDWTGAELVMYNTSNKKAKKKVLFRTSEARRMVLFDGRLLHQVIQKHFKGTRFTIVCFQLWHEDKHKSDPICYEPRFIT